MSLSDLYLKTQFVIVPCHSFTIGCGGGSLAIRNSEGSPNEWPVRAMLIDVVCVILVVIKSKHKLCFDKIKTLLKSDISIWLRGGRTVLTLNFYFILCVVALLVIVPGVW